MNFARIAADVSSGVCMAGGSRSRSPSRARDTGHRMLTSIFMCIYILGVSQSTYIMTRAAVPRRRACAHASSGVWVDACPGPLLKLATAAGSLACSELRDEGRADRLRPRRTHGASTRAVRRGRERPCAYILCENTSPKNARIFGGNQGRLSKCML